MFGTIDGLRAKKKGERPTFGFITGEDGTTYFFVPMGLDRATLKFEQLTKGLKVEFTPTVHDRGPRAIEVRVV